VTAGAAVEEAFAKVLGRQPSEVERGRLYRIRDALGLRDNDAFWYIVLVLEHYDSLYRDYPSQIGDEARKTTEQAQRAFAAAAEAESAKAQRMLAQRVAETSVAIAQRLAERPVGLHRVTAVFAAVLAFGAMCLTAGVELAGGRPGWWVAGTGDGRAKQILSLVLGVPVGWVAFALLLPVAVHGVREGWRMGRDAEADAVHRAIGWGLVGACVAGAVASAALLARTIG
jgi:hypothetical protein